MKNSNNKFSLPAEWAQQSAVQLTWPHSNTDWQSNLSGIEDVYLAMAEQITKYQCLVVACHDVSLLNRLKNLFSDRDINVENVRFFIAQCNDTWARDHGPIILTNQQQTHLVDFTFNAWGSKYSANLDNDISQHLVNQAFCKPDKVSQSSFVLEGGSIESDGDGTLLTTKRCLLNPNRNPELNQQDIEQVLLNSLGMDKVIWLSHGFLAGDDTDAHIDTLARFSPGGIVYVKCDDANDEHYEELTLMERELTACTNRHGEHYTLFPLPMPNAIYTDDGERLPATYANYLITNAQVLVPTYNDKADVLALETIAKAYPDRTVVGINCLEVIKQFGSLHCLTMQLPQHVIV